MNAIPPGGIKPRGGRTGTNEGVRLTFDLDEDEADAALADPGGEPMEADGALEPDAPRAARETGTKPRAGRSPAGDPAPGRRAASVPPRLSAIEVTVTVELGSQRLSLRDLMAIEPGQLFSLDRLTSEPVDILVNGRPFARGEVVAIGDRYGVRLTELADEGDPA